MAQPPELDPRSLACPLSCFTLGGRSSTDRLETLSSHRSVGSGLRLGKATNSDCSKILGPTDTRRDELAVRTRAAEGNIPCDRRVELMHDARFFWGLSGVLRQGQ